ncbi:hypothetical protein ACYT85_20850 [Ralstonia solanacearum]|uniref:Uncharacterized protein n=1 Tax=Ralstonia solanacearum TaxID=305 RepID=A0AAW5ZIR5_RALSL|nr:hypothetical protein [Ralstonia solanacearum]MDB0569971.1 hypothetical protein [Ralstonia solanacearum]
MKQLLLAAATGLALSAQLLPLSVDAQATRSTKAASAQPPDTAEFDQQLALVQEQMKTMQAQMDQIRQTQDPQQRQRLLQQHWATMQNTMATMHSMMGYGRMGPGMMGGGGPGPGCCGGGWSRMGGYYRSLTPEQLRQRQYMTDQYLNMQQQMMNNMMWNQQYRLAPSPAK